MLGVGRTTEEGGALHFELLGELSAADVRVTRETALGSVAPPIKQLRARHHALARALAEGVRPGIAASMYNYSPSRVSILQADPSFAELVAHYQAEAGFDNARTRERLVALGVDAMDEISRRLEDPEEAKEIGIGPLLKLTELVTDRTGHGKKTESDINVNIGFADRLRAARERLSAAPTIELLANER